MQPFPLSLHWRHNELDGVSNHRCLGYLPNRLFRRRSKKTLKLRVTGLCEGYSPMRGEFPAQRASNAENVSIWLFDDVIMFCFYRRHVESGIQKGATFSVYHKGSLVVDLAGGYADDEAEWPMRADSLFALASTVKALGAICLALLVDR